MKPITVEILVPATLKKVWEYWNKPEHIKNWCSASDDWYVPYAENDLVVGEKFLTRMASKDGKSSFDFGGTYTFIENEKKIQYEISDGRKVSIEFGMQDDGVKITETFDPETINPPEMQQRGWQAILTNFKKYTEGSL